MNHNFDELTITKQMPQSVTRRAALKKLTAGIALATLLALPAAAAPNAQTSTVLDSAGDALFPFDLYGNAAVPPYLDIVRVSVSSSRGVFHFEIQMNAEIPANADPGLTPSVNHLGATVGILTDRKTAGAYTFFGHTDVYHFNFLVGALYSAADSGIGLDLGWSGFLIDVSTFTEIPVQIRGDTMIFETSAASLGDPTSFDWVVGSECDPVPNPEEKRKSVLLVDFAPDHDYASWPAQ